MDANEPEMAKQVSVCGSCGDNMGYINRKGTLLQLDTFKKVICLSADVENISSIVSCEMSEV